MSNYTIIDQTVSSSCMVSVTMLSYNHASYIAQAIESVLMQETTFDLQVIIAEDDSTDETRSIVMHYQNKYPRKIKIILQNENVGFQKNIRSLFENLNGKYVAFLKGDDYWTDPLKLQKQVDFLEINENYGLVFTVYQSINERKHTKTVHAKVSKYDDENLNYLFNADMKEIKVNSIKDLRNSPYFTDYSLKRKSKQMNIGEVTLFQNRVQILFKIKDLITNYRSK